MQIRRIEPPAPPLPRRKRVAAYARVSDGKEAMLHSLSAQVSYYSDLIGKNPDWAYAGVYSDEALSGTRENRPGFQSLLAECRAGTVDLVITKSISRLARNTVTILKSIRELKSLEVDIFFEQENIHSLSAEGELMLTILSSYAQEQSRQVSENVKWRVRKQFSEGRVTGMSMLGYHLVDGVLTIIPEEAVVVKAVFADYLSGLGVQAIVNKYRKQGVTLSRTGVASMLRNEKYHGDMLLQKSFVEDHISKHRVKNTGQKPKFYVQESHEAIIPKDMFNAVQAEIARRAAAHAPKNPPAKCYAFTGIIKCGRCGATYRRKHNAAGTKYEKVIWICPTYDIHGKTKCNSQFIPEDILTAKAQEHSGPDSIAEILVPSNNRLVFIMKSGARREIVWEHQSRRASWTPEMKEAARQKTLERNRRIKENA